MANLEPNELSVSQVRKWYVEAIEGNVSFLWKKLNSISTEHPILLGYKGASEALLGKESWNPFEKYDHLQNAMENLGKAIRLAPESLEVRFLRFSIQHYIPAFVGMSGDLEEDKNIIIEKLGGEDVENLGDFRKIIISFMIESGRCDPGETKQLQSWLVQSN